MLIPVRNRSTIYFCSLVKCFDRNSQNNIRTFNTSFNTHVFRYTQVQISPLYTHSVNWLIEHLFYGIRNSRTGFSSAICSFPYKLKFTNYLLLSCFFNNLLVHPENVKILLSSQNLHNTHQCILSSATWVDHNDPSKPSHRLTNGPEPSKTIESDGSNIKKPS